MMDKMPCLPVKIMDKKWADKLQAGSVFMRSLYEYGSWSAIERSQHDDKKMKSGVQGDVGEGTVRKIDPKVGDDFFNSISDSFRKNIKGAFYIDEERYQFYNIYCLYGLTYLVPNGKFEQPDERLKEFGNTAVIIYNPNEFLNRVLQGLYKQYGDNINFRLDEVHYYPSNYYGDLDEFCKSVNFSWQNELRMRVALLDKKDIRVEVNGQIKKRIIQDISPIIIEIGDITDISIQIPTRNLIDLKLPKIIQLPTMDIQ